MKKKKLRVFTTGQQSGIVLLILRKKWKISQLFFLVSIEPIHRPPKNHGEWYDHGFIYIRVCLGAQKTTDFWYLIFVRRNRRTRLLYANTVPVRLLSWRILYLDGRMKSIMKHIYSSLHKL